ncbi:hypothetical protein [Devosia sp. 2618]|uniref:hypothetical protein n=1 Tax=Devosia sp. 2618 TaxID=3156454 RepID=UPI003392EE27
MTQIDNKDDAVLLACDAMLREVGNMPLTPARLEDASGVIRSIVAAIRTMDEVDVSEVEPAFAFRVKP